MQEKLIELGLLTGRANGRADSRTIRAFLAFCRQSRIEKACRMGPLDPRAIEAFVGALRAAQPTPVTRVNG